MQDHIQRLLRDVTLVTLALAIALGWSLFQVAKGIADLVSTLLTSYSGDSQLIPFVQRTQPLTWVVSGRILTFGSLLVGLVEFGVVLLIALSVRAKSRS